MLERLAKVLPRSVLRKQCACDAESKRGLEMVDSDWFT